MGKQQGFLFTVIVLVLLSVMPLATSANRGSATGTPTPTVLVPGNPIPITSDDINQVPMDSIDIGAVDEVLGPVAGVFTRRSSGDVPDPEAMEAFRAELLDLVDVANELYPFAEHYAKVTGTEPVPRVNRQVIQMLTHEQLYMVREAFGARYEPIREAVESLKPLALSQGDRGPGPSPSSFTIIPTPTPVSAPPPGIRHAGHKNTNSQAGDFPTIELEDRPSEYPQYPTAVGCPKTRFDPRTILALQVTTNAIGTLSFKFVDDTTCKATLVFIGIPIFGGFGTNLVGCFAASVIKGIGLVFESVLNGLNFCIDSIDNTEINAGYQNVRIIHADLDDHDENLTARFNATDKFLFQFRNLELRGRIEANLASNDDAISLFALPNSICIPGVTNDDKEPFKPGCGLLEVVSDTVKSTIIMYGETGQNVSAAEREFDIALDHFNNRRWHQAYHRFRQAYQKAVVGP